MEHTDRRVRRTQKSLGDALIALTLEKEYDEITIQEITDRADIGYRTFFRHYADKDELLKDVLSSVRIEMRELMGPPPLENLLGGAQGETLPDSALLFRHVQKNSDLYRALLFSNRGLVQPMKAFAIQELITSYSTLFESDVPIEIFADHMVSSMVSLLRWWLENDMCYSPEEMGQYAFRLIVQPALDLILQSSGERSPALPNEFGAGK